MKFNYELLFSEIKRKGIKLGYVAEQTGMSRQNLSAIKNGERELSGTNLVIICEMLRSPMDMFIKK